MSQSFASGRGSTKNTCPKCKRTVRIVVIDGRKVETDTELISVVVQGVKRVDVAHRVHGELCDSHRIAAEKKAFFIANRKAGVAAPPTYAVTAASSQPPVAPSRPIAEVRKSIAGHYRDAAKAKAQAWKRAGL